MSSRSCSARLFYESDESVSQAIELSWVALQGARMPYMVYV